jgi:hypothetical protein
MPSSAQAQARREGFFRTLWRLTRQLFHETTGTLFLILALSWSVATLRNWRSGSPSWLLGACLGVAAMMTAFGLISFRSARRLR